MENIMLPEAAYLHAIISLNKSNSMLIGGNTKSVISSKKTYYYNHFSKTWVNGPELLTGRYGHTAGLIMDHITQSTNIVVVGGSTNVGMLDSVELLYSGEDEWKQGIYIFTILGKI